jgi:hypothetical protein
MVQSIKAFCGFAARSFFSIGRKEPMGVIQLCIKCFAMVSTARENDVASVEWQYRESHHGLILQVSFFFSRLFLSCSSGHGAATAATTGS